MDDVKKDASSSQRQFEIYWKTQLHGSLVARKTVAGSEIGTVIQRLHEFCQLVDDKTFEVAAVKTLGGAEGSRTVLELHDKLADRLVRGLRGAERKIVRKALQEAFLEAAGVQYELPLSAFGRKFGAFLQRHGSRGLITPFLRSLLVNEILMRLEVLLQREAPDARALEAALEEIDNLCLSAIGTSLDEQSKWPKLNRDLARHLIHALESQIGRVNHHSVA
jgi:hypothetical protein